MNLELKAFHRLLIRATLSGMHLFAWIFVFQYFYIQFHTIASALASVLLTYALSHVLVILLTPLTAMRLRSGFKRTLVIAVLALAASFAVLASAFSGALGDVSLGIALFAALTGIYRAFYWVPYEISKGESSLPHREWIEILVALLPLMTGMYLALDGASISTLLYIGAGLTLLSIVPLFSMRDGYEGYAWGYRQSFHELFEAKHRPLLWSSLFAGIEGAALFVLWPITVFTLLDWSYPLLGVVMALTLLFTLISRKLFGRAVVNVPVRVQPLVAASGWFMRLGVSGFVGAILVDTYFHTASRSSARGLDMNSLEQIADNHTFVDEYTALKEMGMALGRIVLCGAGVALLSAFPLAIALAFAFVLAAVSAGFSVYFATRPKALF